MKGLTNMKLKREVITAHLIPRKISYSELKQTVFVPLLFAGCVGVLTAMFI